MPRDRFTPRAEKPAVVASVVVTGSLSRPSVRRVLGDAISTPCTGTVTLVIAPSGTVVDASCPALRVLRFPPADGVTSIVLTLATP